MMFAKKAVKGINEYLVCEQRYKPPHRRPPFDPTSYGGVPFPTYSNGHHHHVYEVTADVGTIEEQLLMMELEKQAPLRHHRIPDPTSSATWAKSAPSNGDHHHYEQLVRSPTTTTSPGRAVKNEEWRVVDLDDRVTSWEQETMITSTTTKIKIKSPAHIQPISSEDHVTIKSPAGRRALPSYDEAIHQRRSSPFGNKSTSTAATTTPVAATSYHRGRVIGLSSGAGGGEEQVSHV